MEELIKVNDSHKSVESGGGGHDKDVTASEKVDRDEDRRSEARECRQHLFLPIYERMKGRLQIGVDWVVGLTISSTRVPYNESI